MRIEAARKLLKEKGQNVVFYISYSGLGKDIEPNISETILKDNFKLLNENGIDVIHYYRPFLPQNSDPKKIQEMLDYVNQYTDVSVTTGLALIETFIDKLNCWDEVKTNKEACLKANCVWPDTAWNFFNDGYSHNQQIFQTNTCGLNSKLKRPSTQYYGTEECLKYNHCSKEQIERCRLAHQKLNENLLKERCSLLLKKLGFDTNSVEYSFDEYGSLEIKNIDLKIKDASYLSYKLGIKVYVSTNKGRWQVMKDIIKFLDTHYDAALKLVSDFDITKSKEWNPQVYLNELYVQLGHVYNVYQQLNLE